MNKYKVIITFICVLVLTACIGCNKTDSVSITSDNDKSINEPKTIIEKLPSEEIPNEEDEYKIKANIIFYVLKDEYFENNDVKNPNASEFIRNFICYNGVKGEIYPHTDVFIGNKVNSIQELRDILFLKYPNILKLPPNTIVSDEVLKKWESQGYNGLNSYSDESPAGLTYSEIN